MLVMKSQIFKLNMGNYIQHMLFTWNICNQLQLSIFDDSKSMEKRFSRKCPKESYDDYSDGI
jgi:hypothetical protein